MQIDPNYFLDEMLDIEIDAILEVSYDKFKKQWEQTRWLGYVTAGSMTGAYKKPEDLLKFVWDKKVEEKIYTQEELVNEQNNLINIFKNNGKI